jgi:hypothetical protein
MLEGEVGCWKLYLLSWSESLLLVIFNKSQSCDVKIVYKIWGNKVAQSYSDWLLGGWLVFNSWHRGKDFLFSTTSWPALGPTQPSILWVLGTFPGGKVATAWIWPPPSSARVKNACSYTSTPSCIFMVHHLIKHRDNFYPPAPSLVPLAMV